MYTMDGEIIMTMTNDQVALLCAAVSENVYSTAAIIIQAGKFAEALGSKLYDLYLYYNEPTITVESVEFNENCRPTHMFVIDMKGYPLRVFDCSE